MNNELKVLLVDDEEGFVSALAQRLKLRGIDARAVKDAETALCELDEQAFDMIVLDIFMPGMGGMAMLKQINQKGISTPVLLLTGHGSTKEGIEGMKLGAYDYLMKPVDIDQLIEKIESAVS